MLAALRARKRLEDLLKQAARREVLDREKLRAIGAFMLSHPETLEAARQKARGLDEQLCSMLQRVLNAAIAAAVERPPATVPVPRHQMVERSARGAELVCVVDSATSPDEALALGWRLVAALPTPYGAWYAQRPRWLQGLLVLTGLRPRLRLCARIFDDLEVARGWRHASRGAIAEHLLVVAEVDCRPERWRKRVVFVQELAAGGATDAEVIALAGLENSDRIGADLERDGELRQGFGSGARPGAAEA